MIPAKTLCAALQFVADASAEKDVRFYLLGVLFEFKAPNVLTLVATNGAKMHVAELTTDEHGLDMSFIVGSADVSHMLSLYKKTPGRVTLCLGEGGQLGTTDGTLVASFKPIDGRFPDWRCVIPRGAIEAQPGHWDPVLLAETFKAAAGLAKGAAYLTVKTTHYGGGSYPCLRVDVMGVPHGEVKEAFAIVMGKRV